MNASPAARAPAESPDLPPHVHGRKATWFELFFDLVFVVVVAQLSATYAHHFDPGGAAGSALLLLVLWWCWLGHTFHATRFDAQRLDQRWLGLAQILAVTLIGYGVSDAFGARGPAFALGVALFKGLLALAYLREWRWRGARGLIRAYAALYGLQALLWLASIASPAPARVALWGVALALDLASPWWVARYTTVVRPHPEHLPERFGLFTIILLGEGVASVVHALDHGASLHAHALLPALAGSALTFLTWLGYFEVTRAHDEREVAGATGGRNLRLWAYGHVPIYMGVFSLAAGTVALAGDAPWSAAQFLLHGAGIALIPLGLLMLRAASNPGH
jgi:low temperature requirement protein LtrA